MPMGKEVVEMSTDEESDCVVICPPNGKAHDHEEVISGSHDDDSPKGQEIPRARVSDMDSDTLEDRPLDQDSLEFIDQQKSALPKSPTTPGSAELQRSSHPVPQPFALSTERRASGGGNRAFVADAMSNGEKLADKSSSSPAITTKKSTPVTPRKPLQPDNTSHTQEEDSSSVTSSTATSSRAGKTKKTTVPVAPIFVCGDRADKRREYYTKLEEKHKALEEEKVQAEARKKEEQEAALKELRKNLVIRAKPMPSFYQEGPPPKVELKKVPPTRAKSPKLSRRKSCSDTPLTPEGQNSGAVCCRLHRLSMGNSKDANNRAHCSPKGGVATKPRAAKTVREEPKALAKNVKPPSAANVAVKT